MLQVIEFLAVISSACFGVLLARSKQMDLVGVCSVAFVLAFGGGTLRDVLLDRQSLFWIANEHYAWTVFGIAILGSILPRLPRRLESWLNLPDALGLAFFSIAGAGIAIRTESVTISPFIASIFGVMTATFGGVLADIMCNDVPRLFRPTTPLYASCSFAGCWVYLLLRETDETIASSLAVVAIIALRLVAVRKGWKLPAPRQ